MSKALNIHYFQHAPFEGPGIIEDWVKSNNHKLSSTKFYEKASPPELEDIDWLIVMGGPMGVYDEDKLPWLKAEKDFIAQAINQNKIVLGICLGSQLIASAAGARVYPNKQKEIGWFPLQLTDEGKNNSLFKALPDDFTVFHWHGDTFNLPPGAVRLAGTAVTENQAFVLKDRVLGLQFHMEVTEESIAGMLHHCKADIVPSEYVQTVETIRSTCEYISGNNKQMARILDALASIDS